MWTCITLVCSDSSWAKAFDEELAILNKQNELKFDLSCLVIQDRFSSSVRDGGATLNALLVTVEKLCNKRGFENVTSDVLLDSSILIVHTQKYNKNHLCYWPNGIFLPTNKGNPTGSRLQIYLEQIMNVCSQLRQKAPPGVWVVTSDLFISGLVEEPFDLPVLTPDALLLTSNCKSINEAPVDSNELKVNAPDDGKIIYLKSSVAQILLSLSIKFPLDCCTYLGEDSGAKSFQLSLYYDLLGPLWIKDKDSFLSGCNLWEMDTEDASKIQARLILWEELQKYHLYVLPVNELKQINCAVLPIEQILRKYSFPLHLSYPPAVLHSYIRHPMTSIKCITSLIEPKLTLKDDKSLYVIGSSIETTQPDLPLRLEGDAYLINVKLDLDQIQDFFLKDNICMIGYSIRSGKEKKMGRSIFSAADIPFLDHNHPHATIFGLNWSSYFALKRIEPEDVWGSDVETRSLMTARLFPLAEDSNSWEDLLWLQELTGPSPRLESWRNRKRYSMNDFLDLYDPLTALQNLKAINIAAILKALPRSQGSFVPYFKRACEENWSNALLSAFDQAAIDGNGGRDSSRALAAIADLLSYMANSDAGSCVRSGPASNQKWTPAFRKLEESLHEGVVALANERNEWMTTPERLIRAARHYERAVHILIRETVKSVQHHMVNDFQVSDAIRSPMGTWIEAECPARIDLSGGWSDTPPICYEAGGSVVNLAVLVDGAKPIGARGRRTEKLQIVLVSEGQSEPLIISSMEDVMNYSNPTMPGALLKAALVCAGVVQPDCGLDLSQQLEKSLGGGLELHGWSRLPQGSGLGTSSILASALLAVIYSAMGCKFNRSQLIHAVLYVEQLLTTGGGWQDQVGGVVGGCNRGHSSAGSSLYVQVEHLDLSERTINCINERLLLVHTGKVRLARNLLQNVIRNWYSRDEETIDCFRQLVNNADACKNALLKDPVNCDQLCHSVDTYWSQKKILAPGCEPEIVKMLINKISPFVHGQSLAGAGGGGFYYGFLKTPSDREKVEKIVSTLQGCDQMTIHRASVDQTGISLKMNGCAVDIPLN